MHQPVVAMTEQHQVLEGGVAAVAPVHQVVGVGPRRGSIAAGPHAPLVADPERGTARTRRHPERASDIDYRGVRAEQDAQLAAMKAKAQEAEINRSLFDANYDPNSAKEVTLADYVNTVQLDDTSAAARAGWRWERPAAERRRPRPSSPSR